MRRLYALLLTLLLTLAAAAQTAPPATLGPWAQQLGALAAAQLQVELDHAYRHHIGNSLPLPPEVQQFLRGLLPDDIIDDARYTVSLDAPTLPDLLNRGNRELLGLDHAVSVRNLVIFSRQPTFASAGDARWWAHELGHHLQYQRWGLEEFARRYVTDFAALEQEAERFGAAARNKWQQQAVPGPGSS